MPGRSVIVRIRFVALLAVPAIIATLLMPSTSASASPLPAVQGQAVGQDSDEPTPTLLAKPKKNKKKWQAKGGARFNNPMIEKQRFVIERHIIQAIRNSPKGSKITISAYSLDRGVFARELIAAYRRGVKVQVLLNDHQVSGAQVAIQRVIGAKTKKKSFLRRCVSGCRADQNEFNNLHSKFYLFSQTGKSRHVVMLGSQNMTLNAVRWQWNDLFTIPDNEVLYDEFQALFNDMRPDWKKRRATYEFCDKAGRECPLGDLERYHTTVFPRFTTQKRDVIMHVLNNIQCRYVDPETGKERRTVLRLSMHTMRGSRGNYPADKLRSLYALGCDLKVNYGLMGFHTKEHLGAPTPRGRVPLRSTGFSLTEDSIETGLPENIERYTHHKYFVLRGSYKGNPQSNMVWTGSTNWASLGTPQDEILFSMHGAKRVNSYLANFDVMWRKPFSRDAYTTTYESWRPVNGSLVGVNPTITVEPDGLRAAGRTWEND